MLRKIGIRNVPLESEAPSFYSRGRFERDLHFLKARAAIFELFDRSSSLLLTRKLITRKMELQSRDIMVRPLTQIVILADSTWVSMGWPPDGMNSSVQTISKELS